MAYKPYSVRVILHFSQNKISYKTPQRLKLIFIYKTVHPHGTMTITRSKSQRDKYTRLRQAEFNFVRAYEQIKLLDREYQSLYRRNKKMLQTQDKALKYSVRNRMLIVEGVREIYFMYSRKKAENISILLQELKINRPFIHQ